MKNKLPSCHTAAYAQAAVASARTLIISLSQTKLKLQLSLAKFPKIEQKCLLLLVDRNING
jgi:hypothetical protein